jgi:hypothetical protein
MSYLLEGEAMWELGATHEKGQRRQKVDSARPPGLGAGQPPNLNVAGPNECQSV